MFGKEADALLNEPVVPEGWSVTNTGNVTPNRSWDYHYYNYDYDYNLDGHGSSIADCIEQINVIINDGVE